MREVLLLLLAACGRVGFDARIGASGDASSDVAASDASDAAKAMAWSHLVAYADQTCALEAGVAYCWGKIGAESGFAMFAAPHAYSVTGVTAIAPGEQFTCIATPTAVDCFGNTPNGFAAYGPFTTITAMSAGRDFACFIDDSVRCFGTNDAGQLGTGDTMAAPLPTANGLSNAYTQIRAGDDHACVAGPGMPAMCWGHNDDGTMGTGSTSPPSQLTPQAVMFVDTLPLIAGWHACALYNGGIFCWGRGNEGELGDAGTVSSPTPSEVILGGTVLATGGGPTDHDASCAVIGGQTKCWGDGSYGRLGQGTSAQSLVPVDVIGLPGVPVELALGYDHTCALLPTDEIWCWGRGDLGQLGDGLMTNSMSPVKVALP